MTCIATAPVSPSRAYQYDTLGRPTSRTLARQGATRNDAFTSNDRSELISDIVDGTALNGWDYDNIGNRRMEHRSDGYEIYTANQLNQYTAIEDQEGTFQPTYDDDGNQTRIKTSTGVWNVTYNAKNRPVLFSKDDNSVSVECTYDYMGRRATKKVTENGTVTLHQRYLYRGYLQIACCDLLRPAHPCIWFITWDPTQPEATRPLAIQKDATWYTYGWDVTKNTCEIFGQSGYIRATYTYSPYGLVSSVGDVEQPFQWGGEFFDTETKLVYYNQRYYSPNDGRWLSRDAYTSFIFSPENLYLYVRNNPLKNTDFIGFVPDTVPMICDITCYNDDDTCDWECHCPPGYISTRLQGGGSAYFYKHSCDKSTPPLFDKYCVREKPLFRPKNTRIKAERRETEEQPSYSRTPIPSGETIMVVGTLAAVGLLALCVVLSGGTGAAAAAALLFASSILNVK